MFQAMCRYVKNQLRSLRFYYVNSKELHGKSTINASFNTAYVFKHGLPQSAARGRGLWRIQVTDLWSVEAAQFPQPLTFVGWAVVSLREKDDGGNQLMLQVLRQLLDGPDQSEPEVLRDQNTDMTETGAKMDHV